MSDTKKPEFEVDEVTTELDDKDLNDASGGGYCTGCTGCDRCNGCDGQGGGVANQL